MNIFLSHVYEERNLAQAFKQLIEKISEGQIQAWYSSDPRPSGGMDLGDWRHKIQKEMEQSEVIVAIITPDSNGVAWVAWESGFAIGKAMVPIPLVYFMKEEQVHAVYSNLMAYSGENNAGVARLCAMLMNKNDNRPIREAEILAWEPDIEIYLKAIHTERRQSYTRSLFHDHFHNTKRASQMENKTWYALWNCEHEDGSSEVFELDSLTCWSTDTRLRMVGDGVKGAAYPMEGVISSNGHIALSYWSEGSIPICGTVLMEPADLTGDIMIGTWSGFTARSLKEKTLRYYRGRVVMALEKSTAENWVFD